jgi:hypothetical protein
MDGGFNFALDLGCAAFGRGIVGAMEFGDLAGLRIFRHPNTFDDVGVPEPHFASWSEPEKLFGWVLAEIVSLNIEDA